MRREVEFRNNKAAHSHACDWILAIFDVRQIPYEFDNEWLVLVPALILVYALTVWAEGKIFKEESVPASVSKPVKKKAEISTKGFK